MKSSFLDKLIGRMDRVDPQSLQSFVQKLAREKGFLETLFNTIQEGILVTDAEGRISYFNHAAGELLGIPADRGAGEPLARYLRDLDWDQIWSAGVPEWRKVVARELEVFYPRHRFLSFYIVPLADDERNLVTGMTVILRDMTEAHQQTAVTIESEKLSALTLLAAGVAHEIGNPLNSLNIHLQLLERDLRTLPEKQARPLRDNLRVARDEVTRLDAIINQFLRAVRPTRPDLRRGDVNEIVRETLTLLDRELTDRQILVERDLDELLPKILVDAVQLQQAVYNVVRNAIQSMGPQGILRVRTAATEGQVMISVADTGHGIAAEQIGRIFEPYYTTKQQGSGLGLMIVQRIVREHGGTVEIESDVNRGTTVRLRLPVHEKRTRLLEAGAPAA